MSEHNGTEFPRAAGFGVGDCWSRLVGGKKATGWQARRTAVSLFTGAGGLDLGLQAAGFKILLCVERDPDARETLRRQPKPWRLAQTGDVHESRPCTIMEEAGLGPRELTLLSAGPPCQPFSKAANWN